MRAYYNEIDPAAAHVLRTLIDLGVIAPGEVDTRSIKEVSPDDLKGFTQCHFFAGGGLWSVAARLAGWPDERPLWTGSCPCQGESVAGKRLGAADPRHLWPDFFRLIRAARPALVVGEQVAAAAGTHWLDGVAADLESENYAARAVDIPACAVDAPHIRSRLYWCAVADSNSNGSASFGRDVGKISGIPAAQCRPEDHTSLSRRGDAETFGGLSAASADAQGVPYNADGDGCAQAVGKSRDNEAPISRGASGRLERAHGRDMANCFSSIERGYGGNARIEAVSRSGEAWPQDGHAVECRDGACGIGNNYFGSDNNGLHADANGGGYAGRQEGEIGQEVERAVAERDLPRINGTHWSDTEWIICHDGKARRAKSGLRLLVDGFPGRVDLWRIAGNAIVPQAAAEVLGALMDVMPEWVQ